LPAMIDSAVVLPSTTSAVLAAASRKEVIAMNARLPFRTILSVAGIAASCTIALSGCATTAPDAAFSQALPPNAVVDANDVITVAVEAKPGVVLTDLERQRLAQGIAEKIDTVKRLNTNAQDSRSYSIDVKTTRYDKGNAFARMMLAGLGQIHIDAQVAMVVLPEKRQVAAFTVEKTFAWGGVYGASQSIEDVEEGFSQAVAEAVTKRTE